jgi:tRNA modification GTPase
VRVIPHAGGVADGDALLFAAMSGPVKPDTIAGIATAPGEAGIAIVRVSGPDALAIADRAFRCAGPPPSQRPAGTFVHGVVAEGGRKIDEALLLIMRAPHSYTGEDTIEIQCHGGTHLVRRILSLAVALGARAAEPGEFTQRAFLNGRLDLAQAEAVLDLIRARSDRAATSALEQLDGSLSRTVNDLYDRLLGIASDLEAAMDFPEDELPAGILDNLRARIQSLQDVVDKMIETEFEGRVLREGARIVIAGRPNVGKSTLLNKLLGKDRSIVSHHPGTTRDTIEEMVVMNGFPVRLIDTAGLRETDCEVEKIGINRAINELQNVDACLYVVDVSTPPHQDDVVQLDRIPASRCLLVKNKADLGNAWISVPVRQHEVTVSLASDSAAADLIKLELGRIIAQTGASLPEHQASVSTRHAALLTTARAEILAARDILTLGDRDLDLASSRLREAVAAVGRITGRTHEADLLDSIFSKFCIGK